MTYKNYEIVISPADPSDAHNENCVWEIWAVVNEQRLCIDTSINVDGFESHREALIDAKRTIDDPKWFNTTKK